MLVKDIIAMLLLIIYLLVYCLLLQTPGAINYAMWMLWLSPALICLMVYTVLKRHKSNKVHTADSELIKSPEYLKH